VAPPIARSPDDGDDADIRHDSGGHESRLAIVFARILALDIRGDPKKSRLRPRSRSRAPQDGVVFGRIPREAVFEVRVYGVPYSSICVYAIARVI
jgi:hypothetical protein